MTSFHKGERVVARFVLIERLGGSGDREVWRALDESDGTQVAVKLLRTVDALGSTDGAARDLEREHAIARRLREAVPGIRVSRIDSPLQDHDVAALPMQLAAGDARSLRSKPCSRIVPVLIDVDPLTLNMSVAALKATLKQHELKALMMVHVLGNSKIGRAHV